MKGLEVLLNDEHMNAEELGDRAELFHQDLSLLQHQQKTAVDPDAVSLEWCEDCGIEIPEQRRQSLPGVTLCVDCKREQERKDKVGR